jgi:hypothetical protein
MGSERSAGPAFFTPFEQPMMWQAAPIMASAMCSPVPTAQTTLQPMAQPTFVVYPVPQQPIAVSPLQLPPESSLGDDAAGATACPTTTKNGVWESMAAWKAGQSAEYREWNGKETRSQFGTYNQNSVRPRGRNAISKKPADKSDSTRPRAVFVDLSKIVPTGIVD